MTQVLHFRRPGGWQSVTNFGPVARCRCRTEPSPSPADRSTDGRLPADTTAWLLANDTGS